jgi:hypothetical protein
VWWGVASSSGLSLDLARSCVRPVIWGPRTWIQLGEEKTKRKGERQMATATTDGLQTRSLFPLREHRRIPCTLYVQRVSGRR